MGSSEMDKPGKEAKEPKTPTAQEQSSSTTPVTFNPDWPGFQAYSPMPPHGYVASSPQAPHPYMWGVQPIMPPYGTPPHPYVAMYPHGGIYAHPSMPPGSYPFSPFAMSSPNGIPDASENTPSSMEADGKAPDGKEKLPFKRSKGSLGSSNMITGKSNEGGKSSGACASGGHLKSADTQSEGSSEGSDANSEKNDSPVKSGCGQDSLEANASQNSGSAHGPLNGGPSTPPTGMSQPMTIAPMPVPGVTGPTTNLNISMDHWGGAHAAALPAMHGKIPTTPTAGGMVTSGSRDSLRSQIWLQDERELKRQRRKQSNRESARRSRLRKQAECDDLAQRAEVLRDENSNLRSELNHIKAEYEQLLVQNASLKEKLGEVPVQDDPRMDRNECPVGNNTQLSVRTDALKDGQ